MPTVPIAATNTITKNQVEEERFSLAYTSRSLFIIEGNQGRSSSRAGTWRLELITEATDGRCLLAGSP